MVSINTFEPAGAMATRVLMEMAVALHKRNVPANTIQATIYSVWGVSIKDLAKVTGVLSRSDMRLLKQIHTEYLEHKRKGVFQETSR